MPRILFLVFIAFLVWLAVRVLRGRTDVAERQRDERPAPTASEAIAEPILQCAWCGVHVPIGHALTLPDGRLYCSAAHRDAASAASAASAERSGA